MHWLKRKHTINLPLRILLGTNALILVASAALAPIYALFVDEVGGTLLDAGLAGAVFAFTAGITSLLAGRYTDKIKESEIIVALGYGVIGLGYLLFIFINTISMLYAVQVLIGIGSAIYSPAFDAMYSKHLKHGQEGRQWGAWESMSYFTYAAGAAIGGVIVSQFGFDTLFILMGALNFFSAIYIISLPRKLL